MNEPHTMSGRDGLSPAEAWEDVSYKALEAIRATGDSKLVLVSGYDWSSARSWRHHPAPWMEDSNVRYEAHQYFDLTNTGVYRVPYQAEVAAARSRGYYTPQPLPAEHQTSQHEAAPAVSELLSPHLGASSEGGAAVRSEQDALGPCT